MLPGKKGISLSVEQFNAMMAILPQLHAALSKESGTEVVIPALGCVKKESAEWSAEVRKNAKAEEEEEHVQMKEEEEHVQVKEEEENVHVEEEEENVQEKEKKKEAVEKEEEGGEGEEVKPRVKVKKY